MLYMLQGFLYAPVLPGGLWQLALALLWDDLAMGNIQVVTISSAITACDAWQFKISKQGPICRVTSAGAEATEMSWPLQS